MNKALKSDFLATPRINVKRPDNFFVLLQKGSLLSCSHNCYAVSYYIKKVGDDLAVKRSIRYFPVNGLSPLKKLLED
ncbi:Uncharacterised protein [Chlamydia trachomatis]|nr:Uncharacterised protein [Chlamydia trachomatis]